MMAGIPFDVLSASELTDAQLLLGYDALIMPLLSHVATAHQRPLSRFLVLGLSKNPTDWSTGLIDKD
jgi:hypothetical protein